MKKITFVTVAILVSVAAFAQRGIPRTDNVSVSSTVVKKTTKQSDSKKGFQQSVELGTKLDLIDEHKGTTGFNYIGGYRFNNHFFAGIGMGLEFAHLVASGVREYVGSSAIIYSASKFLDDDIIKQELGISDNGSLNLVSIPLYLHLKGYYTKTKYAPYSSLSLGGVFAPKENGLYAKFSTGVDVRLNDNINVYFAAGVWYRKVRDTYLGYTGHAPRFTNRPVYYDEDCQLNECNVDAHFINNHYHNMISDLFCRMTDTLGLSLSVGVSF